MTLLRVLGSGKFVCADDNGLTGDFRDEIDPVSGCQPGCTCERDAEEMGICPTCCHPELKKGEICVGLHVPVELYKSHFEGKIRGIRPGRAYSDDGTLLSRDICSVIVHVDELKHILLRNTLPPEMFLP